MDDGLGWWLEYVSDVLHYHPQFSLDYVLFDLPMDRGRALLARAMERDGWLQLAGLQRIGPGYIRQELDRRTKQK